VQSLLDEFRSRLNDANAVVGFAKIGLPRAREIVGSMRTDNPENPDPAIYLGKGDPNDPASRWWARWRRSQALTALSSAGLVEAGLSQQWIVSVYTAWEHEYRPRFAVVHGCGTNDVRIPMLGDLRLFRNDVVHHHGVATNDNAGCAKILRWFEPGQNISLADEHFIEFVDRFPAEDLAQANWS
jgi:hypothetical protein